MEIKYTKEEKLIQLLKSAYPPVVSTFYKALPVRRRPRVIQLPITGRCNSRCVTCNVWKKQSDGVRDIEPKRLLAVLKQEFFSEVTTVGVNGGGVYS